jgi:hypothetical protein
MVNVPGLVDTFERDLRKSIALVDSVQELRFPAAAQKRFPALPYLQVTLIAELAFLRCFLAWETFLEGSFVCYLGGKTACDGTAFSSYLAAPTDARVRSIIVAEQAKGYVSWASVDSVRKRASVYLQDGEPYASALDSADTVLKDMTTIRNRIAHRSPSASRKFLSLVQSRHGTIPRGITPGRFLLLPGLAPPKRRLEEYIETLGAVGAMIGRK